MVQIGAYEAKTHLSELLDRVSKGERIVITKHGTPVAVLAPVSDRELRPTADVIADLRAFRERQLLGGDSLKDMIEEGRR